MQVLALIKDEISIDGGLSANPYFCQFLANVLQKEIVVQQFAELTALGTAQLAAENELVDLSLNQKYITRYSPKQDISDKLEIFSRVISFSKGWYNNG